MWPLVAAVGGVLLAVGVVTDKRYFVAGLAAVMIAALEWTIRAWSDRASADQNYNTLTRRRLAHPLELPVAGAVALTVLIYGFSRLMLTAQKDVGPVLFGVMAALILVLGTWFALRRATSATIMAGVIAVGAVAIVGLGVAAAAKGERVELTEAQQLDHFNSRTSVADCSATVSEADEHTPGAVAAKSNVLADMVFDGSKLAADQIGGFENGGVLTIDKGATVSLLFHNDSTEEARLRVFAGSVKTSSNGTDVTTTTEFCTRMVEPGKVANLTVTMPRSSYGLAASDGYYAEVPGHEDSKVDIVVP